MEIFFPKLGYIGSSTMYIGMNDVIIAVFCVFWIQIAYIIYHSDRIKKYRDAVNESANNPYLSPKVVGIAAMISIIVICMAVLSTGYFANRAEYMLQQHEIQGVSGRD